jgi:hypothetical protein
MRYGPALFGHLPEWETPDRQTQHLFADRVDHRPIRFPGASRRRRGPR